MCNEHCIRFVELTVKADEIFDKYILESGSRDVNGSVRPYIEKYLPASYVGTDIAEGKRVDQICNAEDLVSNFGEASFDMVISTEMMEHVKNWQTIISNFKRVLKPGGILYITTRSKGFGYHAYPHDYWRYEIEDMEQIFSDFEILLLQSDPSEPGVFIKARKPVKFIEKDLKDYKLYPIKRGSNEMFGNAPKSFITGVPGWETEEEQKKLLELAENIPSKGLYVEIGGEFGMSASIICAGAKADVKIVTIDLFPGNLLDNHRLNLDAAGFGERSEQYAADSKRLAQSEDDFVWKQQGIDVMFIDSDHSYPGVKQDIIDWSKYVKPGGLLVFHDTVTPSNKRPHPSHYDVSKAVDEWYAKNMDKWVLESTVDSISVFRKLPEVVSEMAPAMHPEVFKAVKEVWPVDKSNLDGENEKDLHDTPAVSGTDGSVKRNKPNRTKATKTSA